MLFSLAEKRSSNLTMEFSKVLLSSNQNRASMIMEFSPSLMSTNEKQALLLMNFSTILISNNRAVGKQRKHQIRDNVEDSDEDDFYHWRRKYKRPKRRRVTRGRTPGERQETPSGGQQTETITIRPSAYETATEYTIARVRKSTQTGGRTTRRRRIERTRSETNRRSHKLEAKAGKEATACFVFESRFGKFVRRDQLKTFRKERYGSY